MSLAARPAATALHGGPIGGFGSAIVNGMRGSRGMASAIALGAGE